MTIYIVKYYLSMKFSIIDFLYQFSFEKFLNLTLIVIFSLLCITSSILGRLTSDYLITMKMSTKSKQLHTQTFYMSLSSLIP